MHSWLVERLSHDVTAKSGDSEDSVSRSAQEPSVNSSTSYKPRTLRGSSSSGLADKLRDLKLQQSP
jgi:hypothetical protein